MGWLGAVLVLLILGVASVTGHAESSDEQLVTVKEYKGEPIRIVRGDPESSGYLTLVFSERIDPERVEVTLNGWDLMDRVSAEPGSSEKVTLPFLRNGMNSFVVSASSKDYPPSREAEQIREYRIELDLNITVTPKARRITDPDELEEVRKRFERDRERRSE